MPTVLRHQPDVLTVQDYESVFRVLERVDTAGSLAEFKGELLDALGTEFGLRHTTFFSGTTYNTLFRDPEPTLYGRTASLFPEYQADWRDYDVFRLPEARTLLERTYAASVIELRAIPKPTRDYLTCLARRGIVSLHTLYLSHSGGHALIELFAENHAVGAREMVILRLLGRQLSAIARSLPQTAAPRVNTTGLSPRQRDVAEFVARGLTNAAIASALALSEDTVKKYVSRILAVTGCRSRTELALYFRR